MDADIHLKRWTIVMAASGVVAFAAVAIAGCGALDMDGMHGRMHRPGDLAPQTPVLSEAEEVTVDIRDYDFWPRDLTVRVGAQVTWANRDDVPHDATAADAWGTGILKSDEGFGISFDEAGFFDYICTVHPYMAGTLTVKAAQ